MQKKFEIYRKNLVKEIITLFSYISIYKSLAEARENRLEEINFAPAFFGSVTQSLYTSIILWISKLFDKNSERGIYNFLLFVEGNLSLFSKKHYKQYKSISDDDWRFTKIGWTELTLTELNKFKQIINKNKILINVKHQRDKFYAHFDDKYFFSLDKLYIDAPIKWNDFYAIKKILDNIINRISVAYDGTAYSFDVVNINDVKGILDTIKKYINDLDNEFEKIQSEIKKKKTAKF